MKKFFFFYYLFFSDIIGICRKVGDLVKFTARSSEREVKKRELTVVDKSLVAVSILNLLSIVVLSDIKSSL